MAKVYIVIMARVVSTALLLQLYKCDVLISEGIGRNMDTTYSWNMLLYMYRCVMIQTVQIRRMITLHISRQNVILHRVIYDNIKKSIPAHCKYEDKVTIQRQNVFIIICRSIRNRDQTPFRGGLSLQMCETEYVFLSAWLPTNVDLSKYVLQSILNTPCDRNTRY